MRLKAAKSLLLPLRVASAVRDLTVLTGWRSTRQRRPMTVSDDISASICTVIDEGYSEYDSRQIFRNVNACIPVRTDTRLPPRTIIVIGGTIVTWHLFPQPLVRCYQKAGNQWPNIYKKFHETWGNNLYNFYIFVIKWTNGWHAVRVRTDQWSYKL